MKLSVVIVNYNVKYFLEQCLHSVYEAQKNIEMEVFVVDNNSVDGSEFMIEEKFPQVTFIANKDNKGFSKANNQAIHLSTGEYVLLLNPDTVVEEDTFTKVVEFMDNHSDAGGLGVKMLDGKGRFLPESKRGLPTPSVAFYKIFGLAKLFPKSHLFGKYHLGFLDKDKTHKIDVLAGAFMLLRRSVLDKIGLLDEQFFMYGEDIDLSYRIKLAGYENYYFPDTRIIHYKGESTKKSSINYVFVFYNAMIIFANKHFTKQNAKLFSFFIKFAIYIRASFSIISRFIKQASAFLADISLIYIGFYLLKHIWELYTHGTVNSYYPKTYLGIIVPAYILVWIFSILFSGGYDKPMRIPKIFQGISIGTLIILVIYALLPEHLRFSRALILMGAGWTTIALPLYRVILNKLKVHGYEFTNDKLKNFAIVGSLDECEKVASFLKNTQVIPESVIFISPESVVHQQKYAGSLEQLSEIVEINNIDEVIFCAKDLRPATIIEVMSILQDKDLDFKIAPPESLYIIGSNSIHTSGDLYVIDMNAISKASNKRIKRTFDLLAALIILTASPLLLIFAKQFKTFYLNLLHVLVNKKSWVGFDEEYLAEQKNIPGSIIPAIKHGVFHPSHLFKNKPTTADAISRINVLYARNYKINTDIRILLKNIFKIG